MRDAPGRFGNMREACRLLQTLDVSRVPGFSKDLTRDALLATTRAGRLKRPGSLDYGGTCENP
jgi:hypothetical protein